MYLQVEGTELRVLEGTGRELPRRMSGVLEPLFDGTLYSSQRTAKREFECQVDFYTQAELTAFVALVSVSVFAPFIGVPKVVTATSDPDGLIKGDAIPCYCIVGPIEDVLLEDAGLRTVLWSAKLALREY